VVFPRPGKNLLKFHQQKLVLHRASMQAYRDFLQTRGYLVHYLDFTQEMGPGYLFDRLRQDGISAIVTCEPVERGLTERYLSSSHYLLKMGDYPAGPWCEIWDGLFWRFIEKHQDYFQQNPRFKPLVRYLKRMPEDRLRELIRIWRKSLGWIAIILKSM
jgi:deoxyribodipyrimidine photolyase-like uncharacterized protein